MRARVKVYYDYLWYNQRMGENLVLLQDNTMSRPLQREIAIFTYRKLLIQIPMFRNANDKLLGLVSLKLYTIIFMEDDCIIEQGDFGKELKVSARYIRLYKANDSGSSEVVSAHVSYKK